MKRFTENPTGITYTLVLDRNYGKWDILLTNSVGGGSGGYNAGNLAGALWKGFRHQADHYPITRVIVSGKDMAKETILKKVANCPYPEEIAAKINAMMA